MIKDIYDAGFDDNLTRIDESKEGGSEQVNQYEIGQNETFRQLNELSLKVLLKGNITMTSIIYDNVFGNGTSTLIIPHNLGYNPITLVQYKKNNKNKYSGLPDSYVSFTVTGYKGTFSLNKRVDLQNLYIDLFIDSTGVFNELINVPIDFKYYILKQRILE